MVPFLITSPFRDDLDKWAEEADLIHNHNDRPGVNTVKTSASADTLSQQLNTPSDRFKKLELLVVNSLHLNRQRSITPRRRRSPSRYDDQICYCHRTNGNKARRCRPGCKYAKNKTRSPSRKFHARQNSKLRFLVDTGSEVNVIPRSAVKRCLQHKDPHLRPKVPQTATPWQSHVFQARPCPSLSPDSFGPKGYRKDGRHYTILLIRILTHTFRPSQRAPIIPAIDESSSPWLQPGRAQTAPTLKSLRRFLGVVNYYGKFIPNCVQVLKPLRDLLRGNSKHFKMMPEAESAFSVVEQQLSEATSLNHLDTSGETRTVPETDASQVAVGAVLQQMVKGEMQPLSFYPKKLKATKTHHNHHSPRETRYLDFISQFTNDVQHIDSASNAVADAMSCMELNQIVVPFLNLQVLISEQRSDPDFTEIESNPPLRLEFLPLPDSDTQIHCEIARPHLQACTRVSKQQLRRFLSNQFRHLSLRKSQSRTQLQNGIRYPSQALTFLTLCDMNTLVVTSVLIGISIVFTIIGVGTNKWSGGNLLNQSGQNSETALGIGCLLIVGAVLLCIALIINVAQVFKSSQPFGLCLVFFITLYVGVACLLVAVIVYTQVFSKQWSYFISVVGCVFALQVAILVPTYTHCTTKSTRTRRTVRPTR
nr:gag pol polyprotein [Hymenolepis microstoma]